MSGVEWVFTLAMAVAGFVSMWLLSKKAEADAARHRVPATVQVRVTNPTVYRRNRSL